VDNAGIAASPLSLLASTQSILAYLNKNPAAVSAFSSLIPASELGEVADSAWVKKNKENSTDKNPSEQGTEVLIAGLVFTEIKEGNASFFLSEAIPQWSWELFLKTAPEWTAGSPTETSQEGVSWFAAKAYCEWIAEQIGKDDGEEKPPLIEAARLPFKGELEAAARAGFAFDGQKYEWCEDFFAPFDFLSADAKSISAVGSPERTVFNRDGEKASLPPDLHSPFVSFRLVVK
jgi:formylglycine-generating enzyme required for sulfatase activity